jgi:hypothetical protein
MLVQSIPLTSTKIYSLMVMLAQARVSTFSLIDICATCLSFGGHVCFIFLLIIRCSSQSQIHAE